MCIRSRPSPVRWRKTRRGGRGNRFDRNPNVGLILGPLFALLALTVVVLPWVNCVRLQRQQEELRALRKAVQALTAVRNPPGGANRRQHATRPGRDSGAGGSGGSSAGRLTAG